MNGKVLAGAGGREMNYRRYLVGDREKLKR